MSRPLTNFRKATEILKDHQIFEGKDGNGKTSHRHAMADSMTHMEGTARPINISLDRAMAQQIQENRIKLKSILKAIIFCGRQNISLYVVTAMTQTPAVQTEVIFVPS